MKEIIKLFKWKEKRKRFGHRQLTCTVMFPYIFRKHCQNKCSWCMGLELEGPFQTKSFYDSICFL